MTMDELLEKLTKKVEMECMESHRGVVAAMTAQAAVHLIDGDEPAAVSVVGCCWWSL